jgi:hypothetical protein
MHNLELENSISVDGDAAEHGISGTTVGSQTPTESRSTVADIAEFRRARASPRSFKPLRVTGARESPSSNRMNSPAAPQR